MNVLNQYIEEGRLIRNADPSQCPSSLMPEWMAHLTPWIDDAGTDEHWPVVIRRYADLQKRWYVITPEDWAWLEYRVKQIALRETMKATTSKDALGVCECVDALLVRALSGDVPTKKEWKAAAEAAWAAADAARAAAWAAEAAAWAAADAASASA